MAAKRERREPLSHLRSDVAALDHVDEEIKPPPNERNLAVAVDEAGELIKRPKQVKLTLSDDEKRCLDILRLAKGQTTSDFLRQQIRDAYHAHLNRASALRAVAPNGHAKHR